MEIEGFKSLRRCVLEKLYQFFQEHPFGLMEIGAIEEACQTHSHVLNWNLVYLEKCGYIELDKSQDCPPYISCAASITARGVDIVENRSRFDELFPI